MTTEFLQKPNPNYPVLTKYDNTTANRVITTDINSRLITSIVTSTELSYLSGATSNIQSQINTLIAGGLKYNSTAILDPTATDDSSLGYTRCSLWVNTMDNTAFICVDESVGSAVWDVITWDQQLNTTDDVIFNKVTVSDGLDVVTGDTSVVNFKPGSQGSSGNFLKSDGVGGVYWGSDTGIIYNGTLPSVIGGHIKLNIADGSTVNESKLVEDSTNLNMGGLNVINAGMISTVGLNMNNTKITNLLNPTNSQDGSTKNYVDYTSSLITITSNGGISLVGSGVNPLLTIKGLTPGLNMSIVSDVNSLTLNTLTPTQEYGSLAYANATSSNFIGNRYYQLYSNYMGTISSIVLYPVIIGVSSQIRVGIYRGSLATYDSVLVGTSLIINVTTTGLLSIPINIVGVQNLSFIKNEAFIIAVAVSGVTSSVFLASLSNSLTTY